ncbi:MAG: hypothetical protein M1833_006962 [Piccolia ochrophora]|nr:MAG: hypothetical protein M1833_006962 [Piccolia ochrophora]
MSRQSIALSDEDDCIIVASKPLPPELSNDPICVDGTHPSIAEGDQVLPSVSQLDGSSRNYHSYGEPIASSLLSTLLTRDKQSRSRGSTRHATSRTKRNNRPSTPQGNTMGRVSATQRPDILYETGRSRSSKRQKLNHGRASNLLSQLVSSDVFRSDHRKRPQQCLSARQTIRKSIAAETSVHRARFLRTHKDLFLPLLPEKNYIQRLVERHQSEHGSNDVMSIDGQENGSGVSEGDAVHMTETVQPFKAIERQPRGVKAVMKPYQLSGLSFLVWLNKNGISGILGDEMGLGKTLQTLSLIQYLKETENRPPMEEARPCLVICPLSVLGSWMTETSRWTPELEVLRFQGNQQERNQVKQKAESTFGKSKRKVANVCASTTKKHIISLDSDSEMEEPEGPRQIDLVVTTYEAFQAERAWFNRAFVWKYVILDEGHRIKNEGTLVSKALQSMSAEHKLILTGTPLQNNLSELWALLHWLYPEVFTEKTSENFRKAFDLTRGQVSTEFMDHARSLLELIMMRRMKGNPTVNLDLPKKTEVMLYVPLTPMQRFYYTRLITRAEGGLLDELFHGAKDKEKAVLAEEMSQEQQEIKAVSELKKASGDDGQWSESHEILRRALAQEKQDSSRKSAWQKLMNLVMQLRKCCNHPYILPHAEPDPYINGDHVVRASGKFIVLDKLINELVIKKGKKTLIFSGFTKMLDIVEDLLCLRGGDGSGNFRYTRLDGSSPRARRDLGIRLFSDHDSNYNVMLISTRAGGLGVNLAAASEVIILDQDWNPQVTLQAEARAHRIGQTNEVTIYKLCTQGTVEEQMMRRIQKKLFLSTKVTESMREIHTSNASSPKGRGRPATADESMPQMSTGALMSLVRRGAQTLTRPEIDIDEILNWDWETMLEKCSETAAKTLGSEDAREKGTSSEQAEQRWLSEMEKVEATVFDGRKYSRGTKSSSIAAIQEEWDRKERRVGKNTTVMIDGFAVNKESLRCADWEAVPTYAGKDPRLAEPKRAKKAAIENQDQCQVCWDGGQLVLCSSCPRSYHYDCLDAPHKSKTQTSTKQFHCSQHQCCICSAKTTDAGGLIYRCRWCERGYCDDCLQFDKTTLIGGNLTEYALLGFPEVEQAFYISCPSCTDHHARDEAARRFCEEQDAAYERKWRDRMAMEEEDPGVGWKSGDGADRTSRAASLTDATTAADDSAISTPRLGSEFLRVSMKRKVSSEGVVTDRPAKRSLK